MEFSSGITTERWNRVIWNSTSMTTESMEHTIMCWDNKEKRLSMMEVLFPAKKLVLYWSMRSNVNPYDKGRDA